MGIKRWKLYSDYGDSAMCETGNQPAGHWHPVSEDDYVLYTDYAALKVKLEIAQQLKVAIEDDANRTEAALKARVEELTLKGKEREQIAVDDAELIQTLRAQLEAAKFRIAVLEEELNVAADKLVCDRCGKIGLHRCLPALQNICSTPQLTAQPDGVTVRRIIEWAVARARNRPDTNASIIADEGLDRIYGQALASPAPVCVCGHSKADHAEKHGWECSEECACLKYTPAPAPDEVK